MSQPVIFGDAEAAAAAILVTADLDATVSADLVGYSAGARWIRIARTGGVPTLWARRDNPEITCDVWGLDKADARDLAVAARAALFAARGTYTGNGLRLSDIADGDGLAWDPDGDPHYTFSVVMVTRPL